MPTNPRRKLVKHYDGLGHLHELTFSTYRRLSLLTNDTWNGILAQSLSEACYSEQFSLVAFVFMPEHVHVLVHPENIDSKISRLLARIKQPTSKAIKQRLLESRSSNLLEKLTVRERPGKTCFRFWQAGGGFDRNLFTPSAIEASINYIHTNPVKRGLCKHPNDWKWSSSRVYFQDSIETDLPDITKPLANWFDENRKPTK